MNAAARLFNQGVLSRGWAFSVFLSKAQLSVIVLTIAVLTSALSIVYVTNINAKSECRLATIHV